MSITRGSFECCAHCQATHIYFGGTFKIQVKKSRKKKKHHKEWMFTTQKERSRLEITLLVTKHDQEWLIPIQENRRISPISIMMETYLRTQQNDYFDPIALENIKKIAKEIQCSSGKMAQSIDQISNYLQEFKNGLMLYPEEKTKESQLKTFQIENLEDKMWGYLVETHVVNGSDWDKIMQTK